MRLKLNVSLHFVAKDLISTRIAARIFCLFFGIITARLRDFGKDLSKWKNDAYFVLIVNGKLHSNNRGKILTTT